MNKDIIRALIERFVALDFTAEAIGKYTAEVIDVITEPKKFEKRVDFQ